ncbi:MAG: hypothetical protein U0354_20825 [Candidatus Sericytochromatia bacterium]
MKLQPPIFNGLQFSFGSTFIFVEIPDFENQIYLPGILPNINLSPFPPYEPSVKIHKVVDNTQHRPKTMNFTMSYEKLVKVEAESETNVDDIKFSKIPDSNTNKYPSEYNFYPLPVSLEVIKGSTSVSIDHTYFKFKNYDVDAEEKSLNSYEISIQGGMLSGDLKINKELENPEKMNFHYNINFEDKYIAFVKNTINFFYQLVTRGRLIIKSFDPQMEDLDMGLAENDIANNIEKQESELLYLFDLFENIEIINNELEQKIFFSKKWETSDEENINILGDCIKYGSSFYKVSEYEIPIPKSNYELIIERLKNNKDNLLIKAPNYNFKIGEFNIKIDEVYIQILNPEIIFENKEIKILHEDDNHKYIRVKTDCIIFMIYEKAIKNIESRSNNQNLYNALFSLASIYSNRGNFNEALTIFNKLLQVNSTYRSLNYNLAITYSGINDYENTIKYLKEEIKNFPLDSENSYITLTKCYFYKEEFKDIILDFFKEDASKNNSLASYKSLATIYSEENKKDELLKVLLEETKIIPDEKDLNLIIASLYYEKGEYIKAIEFYHKEINNNETNALSFYNLACSYSLINNLDESLKNLERSIQLDSQYKEMAKEDNDFMNLRKNKAYIDLTDY